MRNVYSNKLTVNDQLPVVCKTETSECLYFKRPYDWWQVDTLDGSYYRCKKNLLLLFQREILHSSVLDSADKCIINLTNVTINNIPLIGRRSGLKVGRKGAELEGTHDPQ